MSSGIRDELTLKQQVYHSERNEFFLIKRNSQSIMTNMDSDVVHCPTEGNKHWLFDPRLAVAVNQLSHVPI